MLLHTGYGTDVCNVLNTLCDAALKNRKFVFHKPEYGSSGGDVSAVEIRHSDNVDEEVAAQDVEPDHGTADNVGTVVQTHNTTMVQPMAYIPQDEWLLEVERVKPQLKLPDDDDAKKQWRIRVDDLCHHADAVRETCKKQYTRIDQMLKDVKNNIDAVETRERHLNSHFMDLLGEYSLQQQHHTQLQDKEKQTNDALIKLTDQLQKMNKEVETMKTQAEAKSNSLSDNSAVIKMKQTVQQLREETKSMNLQVGILRQSVMDTSYRRRYLGAKGDKKTHELYTRLGLEHTETAI